MLYSINFENSNNTLYVSSESISQAYSKSQEYIHSKNLVVNSITKYLDDKITLDILCKEGKLEVYKVTYTISSLNTVIKLVIARSLHQVIEYFDTTYDIKNIHKITIKDDYVIA